MTGSTKRPSAATWPVAVALLCLASCHGGPGGSPLDGGVDPALCSAFAEEASGALPVSDVLGFIEGGVEAGLVFAGGVNPDADPNSYLDLMGSGACMLDFDGDGRLDLFFPARPGRPACGGPDATDRLFRNLGDGRFADVSDAHPGLVGRTGLACVVGDLDGDGDPDLVTTDDVRTRLFENRAGVFVDVTDGSGLVNQTYQREAVWQTSGSLADIDGDGDLDLFVGQFQPKWSSGEGLRNDLLYRNEGGLHFREISVEAGIVFSSPHATLVNLAHDFNGDGFIDFYAGSDGGPCQLYANDGTGRFTEEADLHGLANDGRSGRQAIVMGMAIGSTSADGAFDVALTDLGGAPLAVSRCSARGSCLRLDADRLGLSPSTPAFKWAVLAADFDDDGRDDYFVASGAPVAIFREDRGGAPASTPFNQRSQLFLGTEGGGFTEFAPSPDDGLRLMTSGRAAVAGDLDGDGDLDLVVTGYGQRPLLLWNQLSARTGTRFGAGAHNHPFTVRLRGRRSNPDGIGAVVTVEAGDLRRTVARTGGGPFLSASDLGVHVGLGPRARIDRVTVRWPSGRTSERTDVPDGALAITIEEPSL